MRHPFPEATLASRKKRKQARGVGSRKMKILAAIVLAMGATMAAAQEPPPLFSPTGEEAPAAANGARARLGGSVAASEEHERCVDVRIGDEGSFSCLNQELRRQVDQVNPSPNVAPFDAKSQDLKVGAANTSAVRQQYGPNFGRSVFPYRPPSLVYSSPLGRRSP
jgi:hypothetical protein